VPESYTKPELNLFTKMQFEYKVEGGDFTQAGYASSQIKKSLKQLGVDPAVIKRVVVALYEAEVNIVAHAYRGVIYASIDSSGIKLKLVDEGPGIPDVTMAMTKGFSTASPAVREMGFGAGMGLPNISENADSLTIETEVGKGTTLNIEIRFN
jgi:serine/threonine-protein kinase RsbT